MTAHEPARPRSQVARTLPWVVGLAIWLPGSIATAARMGGRSRLTGPGSDSITPFIDAWTQTAQAWIAPAFFGGVVVFVWQQWRQERRDRRQS